MSDPGVEVRIRGWTYNFLMLVSSYREFWGKSWGKGINERGKEKDLPTLGSASQVRKIRCYAVNSNIITMAVGYENGHGIPGKGRAWRDPSFKHPA